MRLLITGITGFVGSHLAELALAEGAEVVGALRWRSNTQHIDHVRGRLILIEADLRDLLSAQTLVDEARPDAIVHLAAQSFVGASWHAPSETLLTNAVSQTNLLEAVRRTQRQCRFLVIGSSEEYGLVHPHELPIVETNPLRPLSPYAVSKVTQDLMGWQYYKSYGLDVVRARAFNHSVARHTPVLLRDDRTDELDIRYISDLRGAGPTDGAGERFDDGTVVWDMSDSALSVWADGAWSRVRHLSCHALSAGQPMLRLVANGGIVEVTGDHSVMVPGPAGHVAVSARALDIGERLSLVSLPNSANTVVHEDLAWLLGFLVAEGRIADGQLIIEHDDEKLLLRGADALSQHCGVEAEIAGVGEGGERVRLTMAGPEFSRWLQQEVYASDGNKRVPRNVLNAQADAKTAFLVGYSRGGSVGMLSGLEVPDTLATRSPILAAGLGYLITATTGRHPRLAIEVRDGETCYVLTLEARSPTGPSAAEKYRIPDDIVTSVAPVPYDGEVWDFETDDHVFHAGLGRNLVHNTGPRRGESFATSSFAKQIAEIEAGVRERIVRVGDLKPTRDFSDVRDIVRGYWSLLERGVPGEVYNLCSGTDRPIEEVLRFFISASTTSGIEIQRDPSRMRPSDVPMLRGSADKIEKATGWRVTIPFEQTLRDLLDYWRSRTGRAPR